MTKKVGLIYITLDLKIIFLAVRFYQLAASVKLLTLASGRSNFIPPAPHSTSLLQDELIAKSIIGAV